MKIELLQENFVKALTVVSRSVSSKTSLPVLSHILFSTTKDGFFLSATNLETGAKYNVPSKVEEPGDLSVPARVILEYVAMLPPEKMKIFSVENQLVVSSGGFEAKIDGMSSAEFPKLPVFPTQPLLSFTKSDFVRAMSLVSFSAASDEGRPVLTGIKTTISGEGVVFAATDGYRLSVLKQKIEKKLDAEVSMIIPSKSMVEASRVLSEAGEKENLGFALTEEKNQAIFSAGNVELSTRLIEGAFPNFEKIIPSSFAVSSEIQTDGLLKAVRAASVFARDSANIIKLRFLEKGGVVVSANTPQVGSNTASVDSKNEGKETEIAFNSRFLLEFLANVGSGGIEFSTEGELNPGVFKIAGEKNYLHIIMPVRVQ